MQHGRQTCTFLFTYEVHSRLLFASLVAQRSNLLIHELLVAHHRALLL